MKFEEKLIKLRKENALSQEELGEKLNVTRQTISKWELGQTKPDSEKIMEIAKLFNVSTDELLNESDEGINTKINNTEKTNDRRNTIIVIVLIAILAVIVVWVGGTLLLGKQAIDGSSNAQQGIIYQIMHLFDKGMDNASKIVEKGLEEQKRSREEFNERQEKYNEIQDKALNTIEKGLEEQQKMQENYNEIQDKAKNTIDNANELINNQMKNMQEMMEEQQNQR